MHNYAGISQTVKALHKMLESLEWEPLAEARALQSRRTASRLIMFKKIQTGQVAIPAQKFLQPVSRPTRHNNSKAYQRYQTKKDCFLNARTIAEWNKLPEEIVNIGEIETFKEAITTHLKQATQGFTLHMTGYAPACTKSVEKGSVLDIWWRRRLLQKGIFFAANRNLGVLK